MILPLTLSVVARAVLRPPSARRCENHGVRLVRPV